MAVLGFSAIKQIAEKGDGTPKIIGFTLGAVTGSVFGIFVSKMILKQ
jgi:ABC-type enterobactin transport system permease subunit